MNVIGSNHTLAGTELNSTRNIVKRIEMRQSHAISNIKVRKSYFDNYN